MKYRDIKHIHAILRHLAGFTLPVGYAIAKNLRIAERIVKENDAIRVEECEKRALRNEDGTIQYVLHDATTHDVVGGISDPSNVPEGHYCGYALTDEGRAEIEAMTNEMDDTEHDVQWHTIPESKIEQCNVPGGVLMPLIGTIIKEGA